VLIERKIVHHEKFLRIGPAPCGELLQECHYTNVLWLVICILVGSAVIIHVKDGNINVCNVFRVHIQGDYKTRHSPWDLASLPATSRDTGYVM